MNKIKDFLWAFKQNKKAQIIIGVILLVLLLILAGYLFFRAQKDTSVDGQVHSSQKEVDTKDYPVAIVIENLSTVRPQAGLSKADIVYETLAEGGITRFLAVFTFNDEINEIGPVRSARNYFVDWSEEYKGIFAHVGGSPQALGVLNSEEYMIDLNQFYDSAYFWRDENIPAPHNLMTSSEKMEFAIRDKVDSEVKATYDKWLTKEEADTTPQIEQSIQIDFSSESYAVEWKYDSEANDYSRYNGGEEHKDRNTDEQIKAKNILVQYVSTSLLDQEGRLDIETIGQGDMILFRDGEAIEGTWKKEGQGERTLFYDDQDELVELNEGITWVEVVPEDRPVTY